MLLFILCLNSYAKDLSLQMDLAINVSLTGEKSADQNLFYNLFDQNNSNKLIKSGAINNGNVLTLNYPVNVDNKQTPTLKYTLVIYGVRFQNHDVIFPINVEVSTNGIYTINKSVCPVYGPCAYFEQFASGGVLGYKISFAQSLASFIAITTSDEPNDIFKKFMANNDFACSDDNADSCNGSRDLYNKVNLNIVLPYSINYITTRNITQTTLTKSYSI